MTPDPYAKGGEFYSEPRSRKPGLTIPLVLLATVVVLVVLGWMAAR